LKDSFKAEAYVEASSYIRVLEKSVMSRGDFEKVLEADTLREAFRVIAQSSSFDFSNTSENDIQQAFEAGLEELYKTVLKLPVDPQVVALPAIKYAFHNLKVAAKSKVSGKAYPDIYLGVPLSYEEEIRRWLEDGDTDQQELPGFITAAYKDALLAYGESKDPQDIDIVLDKAMLAAMLASSRDIGSEMILEYVRMSIDFYNLKAMMRSRQMSKGLRFFTNCFAPGGQVEQGLFVDMYNQSSDRVKSKFYYQYFGDMVGAGLDRHEQSGNFSHLEKLLDDALIRQIQKAKYIAFGPEVPFAYIISRENELRQIRILLSGKANQIDPALLKERLRENYA